MSRSAWGARIASEAQTTMRRHPLMQTITTWPVPIEEIIRTYAARHLTIRQFPPTLTIPRELHGLTLTRSSGDATIWTNPQDSPLVQRFTLAHEFAHVLAGHLEFDPDRVVRWPLEVVANAMAAELLLPWHLLASELPPVRMTTPTAWQRWRQSIGRAIVQRAEVSPSVLDYHCVDLGIVTADVIPLLRHRHSSARPEC